ncbi:N-acetylmuramic acid 6-phosphate etherase, partial [bacterium]|nr:N-acetylmuramic acid 6-phosphate etherase [bacterium]
MPTLLKKLTTESSSKHDNLEQLSTKELLSKINEEDYTVADAVSKELDSIEGFINAAHLRMEQGGRLFYIGSGTSGRLGIVDASECPPTYGVPHGLVVGIIAGGDTAIRKAVEYAEDDTEQGWKDLLEHEVDERDTLLGISASGTTPYVKGALQKAREHGMLTGSLS